MDEAVQPITEQQKQQVREATENCFTQIAAHYQLNLAPIPILFDLKGGTAGMYKVMRGKCEIRYNPWLFAKYFEDSLNITIPHEVAHYAVDLMFGLRNVRAHGKEWKAVMHTLGADASATARFNLDGIPARRQKRYAYQCGCNAYELTATRHNKVSRGRVAYLCKSCGGPIQLTQ